MTRRPSLDELVREAKADRGADVDWDKVESKLFPRVEREARAQAELAAYGGKSRPWIAGAIVIAAAAAIPLLVMRGPARPLDATVESAEPGAGTLASKDHNAVVHVTHGGGTAREIAAGDPIVAGDTLDTRSGRAVFNRPDPGGISWALEDGSQVQVRGTRGTLILALTKGAVEAQVTPVPGGEAFAIDVEGTRVAVHGTHFRVERQGNRAVVDLGEGVVSIGLPPKSGSTYGDLVTAPAHVELDSADPHGTIKVSHEPSRVRAAQSLAVVNLPKVVPTETVPRTSAAAPAPPPPAAPSSLPPRPAAPQQLAVVAAPAAVAPPPPPSMTPPPAPSVLPPPAAPSVAPLAAAGGPALPPVDPNARQTIVDQVRACARKNVEGAAGVVVTVSTRLDLLVGDDGMVSTATFDPPLKPEVKACVAPTLKGARFAQPGAASVSIDVTP